jgi:MerR family regulatory protein
LRPLLAFTTDHVLRLTGLSASTLRYWERTGVLPPPTLTIALAALIAASIPFKNSSAYERFQFCAEPTRSGWRSCARPGLISGLTMVRRDLKSGSRLPGNIWFFDPVEGVDITGKPPGQRTIQLDVGESEQEATVAVEKPRERSLGDIGKFALTGTSCGTPGLLQARVSRLPQFGTTPRRASMKKESLKPIPNCDPKT